MSDTSSDAESQEFEEGAAATREETAESEEQEEPEQETTDVPESVSGTEPHRRPRLEWREGQSHCRLGTLKSSAMSIVSDS